MGKPFHKIAMKFLKKGPETHLWTIAAIYAEKRKCIIPVEDIPDMTEVMQKAYQNIGNFAGTGMLKRLVDKAITNLETQLAEAKEKEKENMVTIEIEPAIGGATVYNPKDWSAFGKWVEEKGGKFHEEPNTCKISFQPVS